MAIIQESYEIPLNYLNGLNDGTLTRVGSVVRNAAGGPEGGQIVTHLDPIEATGNQTIQNFAKKAIDFAKDNKKTLIVTVAVASASTLGYFMYKNFNKKDQKTFEYFNDAFKLYINEINTGSLKLNSINNLIDALNNIDKQKNKKKIEEPLIIMIDTFINYIFEYTKKLAKDNNIVIDEIEINDIDFNVFPLYKFRDILLIQKKIFVLSA